MAESLAWIRLDTNLPANDKIAELIEEAGARGKAAAFVYVCCLAYSGAHATGGFIKKSALKHANGSAADARLLVDFGLLEAVEGGWLIPNYGTRNVVGAAQQAINEAKSRAGKAGAEARWGAAS